jgi:hypothetical protein
VILESSLHSYTTALEARLHKNLSEVVIPRVLTRYDTPELMQAIFPRPILVINLVKAMGQELRNRLVEEAFSVTQRRGAAYLMRSAVSTSRIASATEARARW